MRLPYEPILVDNETRQVYLLRVVRNLGSGNIVCNHHAAPRFCRHYPITIERMIICTRVSRGIFGHSYTYDLCWVAEEHADYDCLMEHHVPPDAIKEVICTANQPGRDD
jgi:hypothetical protein